MPCETIKKEVKKKRKAIRKPNAQEEMVQAAIQLAKKKLRTKRKVDRIKAVTFWPTRISVTFQFKYQGAYYTNYYQQTVSLGWDEVHELAETITPDGKPLPPTIEELLAKADPNAPMVLGPIKTTDKIERKYVRVDDPDGGYYFRLEETVIPTPPTSEEPAASKEDEQEASLVEAMKELEKAQEKVDKALRKRAR